MPRKLVSEEGDHNLHLRRFSNQYHKKKNTTKHPRILKMDYFVDGCPMEKGERPFTYSGLQTNHACHQDRMIWWEKITILHTYHHENDSV